MKPRKPLGRKKGLRSTGPPKRKTELQRGDGLKPGGQLKRSTIRKRSKKKEREIKETSPARRLYLKVNPVCQVCEREASEHVHEIPRGGCRQQSVRDCNQWLAACPHCHDHELGDYSRWPIPKQVALKWLRQLQAMNEIRSGLPQTSVPEVVKHLKGLLSR